MFESHSIKEKNQSPLPPLSKVELRFKVVDLKLSFFFKIEIIFLFKSSYFKLNKYLIIFLK